MLPWLTFILLAVTMLASAILVITRRNPVASGMWLTVTLVVVGGVYLMLHAVWLFALQIILYAGGIAGLLWLATGLVKVDTSAKPARFRRHVKLALAVALAFAAELGYAFCRGYRGLNLARAARPVMSTQAVALAPWRNYVLPIELTSLLLFAAAVGVLVMARKNPE